MTSLARNLRDTNLRLDGWLRSMLSREEEPAVETPHLLAALLSELLRTGAGLRTEPLSANGDNPELDVEIERYRGNVERLRDLLPLIHQHLLAERDRLEAQRTRVKSAAEWVRASRQTL